MKEGARALAKLIVIPAEALVIPEGGDLLTLH